MPLIEKEVFNVTGYSKKNIYDNQPNMFIKLNDELVSGDEKKVKNLHLDRYIK